MSHVHSMRISDIPPTHTKKLCSFHIVHAFTFLGNTGGFQTWPPHVEKPTPEDGTGESDQPQQQQQHPSEEEPSSQEGQEQQPQGAFHPGVTCDGCNGPIHGIRYKCLVCSDYDLCAGCEAKGKHVDHNMVTINDPFSYNPWGFQNPWAHGFQGHPCHGGWWGQHGHHGFGPRGFQHPCGGRCPRRFGGGHPHCFRGGHPGHRWGGGAPWWRCAANKEAGQASGTSEPMETGADSQQQAQQQQAQQQQQQPGAPQNEEEQRKFLHGVGEAVSSFLEPFGIKVDVDVVGGGEKPPTAPPPSGEAEPSVAEVRSSNLNWTDVLHGANKLSAEQHKKKQLKIVGDFRKE